MKWREDTTLGGSLNTIIRVWAPQAHGLVQKLNKVISKSENKLIRKTRDSGRQLLQFAACFVRFVCIYSASQLIRPDFGRLLFVFPSSAGSSDKPINFVINIFHKLQQWQQNWIIKSQQSVKWIYLLLVLVSFHSFSPPLSHLSPLWANTAYDWSTE